MKRIFNFIIVALLLLSTATATHADTLVDVYRQALKSDPTFLQAQSTWMSARQNIPIARSTYLPQLQISGTYGREYNKSDPVLTIINTNGYSWAHSVTLQVTQQIFNWAVWKAIKGANYSVRSATATYAAAVQDLMVRVSIAYFNVMRAYEALRFTIANKRAVWQQLETARQQFNVGLISVTGVYDAQSVYDQAVAGEIANRNALDIRLEELRAITGKHYRVLNGIKKNIPLIAPKPNNINAWVKVSERQNYAIKAQQYAMLQAKENIEQQRAGAYPTLSAVGSYSAVYNNELDNNDNTRVRAASVGLSLSYAPFQGGLVTASTRQAMYNYLTASGLLEFTHRDAVRRARSSFLGVVTGISQVKADDQAIKSSRNALKATQAGYDVGTRTMVDVLDDLATVYRAEQTRADDQYEYMQNIINLKFAAGTLDVVDLKNLGRWMPARIKMPKPRRSYKPIKFVDVKLEPEYLKEGETKVKVTPKTDQSKSKSQSTKKSKDKSKSSEPILKIPQYKSTPLLKESLLLPSPHSVESHRVLAKHIRGHYRRARVGHRAASHRVAMSPSLSLPKPGMTLPLPHVTR